MYKESRNFANSEVQRCKAEYYTRVINENKQNHSALWKTLDEVINRRKNDPVSCIKSDGIIYFDPKSVANILYQYFSSVAATLL